MKKVKVNQRVQDQSGNIGRVVRVDLRQDIVRVRMDNSTMRDYNVILLKPVTYATRND